MPDIAVFSADFCRGNSVIKEFLERTGLKLVTDNNVVARASEISGMAEAKIEKTFSAKVSAMNRLTHEKERAFVALRLAMADFLREDNLLLSGYLSHLIPRGATHILKVCLVARLQYRVEEAISKQGLTEKNSRKLIARLDGERSAWVNTITSQSDPWASYLYDIVIPMDKTSVTAAVNLIEGHIHPDILKKTGASVQVLADYQLAARVEAALVNEGHYSVGVSASSAKVSLTIDKPVLMVERLRQELKRLVGGVAGVENVECRLGKKFHGVSRYRNHEFELPVKGIVADEIDRDILTTLSERLLLRGTGFTVAHDEVSALEKVKKEQSDILVLDIKKPGMDGREVLMRLKETYPDLEIIVLTGYGTDVDKKKCLSMGAFAYIQKPVDIDVITDILEQAGEQVHRMKK